MNQKYFATFVSGTQEIIGNRLQRFANAELTVDELHDGLVLFTSSLSANQLSELRFFNNVFGLLADLGTHETIDQAADHALTVDFLGAPKARFNVVARAADQPVALANLHQLQMTIAQKTDGTPDAHRPETTFFLWQRQDGRTLWGWQLPRPGFKTRTLEQGELRPELAHIMGLLASLDHKDIVLDPFAGYGAIVRECLQGFHCQEVIAVEYNEHLIPHLKSIPNLIAKQGDAARLPHIETRSVDRVITDPPWGKFEPASQEHLERIYHEALIQMHRVLRVKGCVVMLTAAPFLTALAQEIGFVAEKQYHILVNGQKASLYKLRKPQG